MEEFQQEEGFQVNSLPPRNSIHGVKEHNINPNKKSSLHMLLGSFVFIIIIAAVLYYQFSLPSKEASVVPENDTQSETSQPQDNSQVDLADETKEDDNIQQETDGTPIEDTTVIEEKSEDIIHVIQSGENLFRISLQYYDSGKYYEALAKYNGLSNANDIYAGLALKVPDKKYLNTDK